MVASKAFFCGVSPLSTLHHDATSASAESQAAVLTATPAMLSELVRRYVGAAVRLGIQRPAEAELADFCRQVATFTTALFPGKLRVDMRVDPEIHDDLYFVFEVGATGSIDDIVKLDEQWHRRLLAVAPQWPGLFRLSIAA